MSAYTKLFYTRDYILMSLGVANLKIPIKEFAWDEEGNLTLLIEFPEYDEETAKLGVIAETPEDAPLCEATIVINPVIAGIKPLKKEIENEQEVSTDSA